MWSFEILERDDCPIFRPSLTKVYPPVTTVGNLWSKGVSFKRYNAT